MLHLKRSSESVWTAGPRRPGHGWRKHFASDQQWGTLPKTASLQVFDLDSLRQQVPQELYVLVEAAAGSRSSWTSTSDRAGAGAYHHLGRPAPVRSPLPCRPGQSRCVRDQDETGCHMTATSAQEPAIRIHGLTKSYSELEVLLGVDFEVARGSIFALLGSNGARKTTVVKIVSTLLKADAGEATVNGFDVARQVAAVRSQSVSPGSSRSSTRSSAGGRTGRWMGLHRRGNRDDSLGPQDVRACKTSSP